MNGCYGQEPGLNRFLKKTRLPFSMEDLGEIVKEMFWLFGWKVRTEPKVITITFGDHEILITKESDDYLWLCRKEEVIGKKVLAGDSRTNLYEILISLERYVLGILKLYQDPTPFIMKPALVTNDLISY